jgi:putative pyruvate formate lyase activating enzyme
VLIGLCDVSILPYDKYLSDCELCPRSCHVNRLSGQRGYCHAGATLKVARAALHQWEEPPISGTMGSGTVFFSYCSLGCVYCQNYTLASGEAGKEISVERLANIFLELQVQGAHNVNLVTGTHYAPQIVNALDVAHGQGLVIPIVWNTSGYESRSCLDLLKGSIDIYLTDFKYGDSVLARRYSRAEDYPCVAERALADMVAQVGSYTVDDNGLMSRGVIVRHLLLPGHLEDSKGIVSQLFDAYGDSICISLMNQYTPLRVFPDYPNLEDTVAEDEYAALIDFAVDLGITNSFMQEGGTAEESFIPAFDLEGV